jgi:hypothetical protein
MIFSHLWQKYFLIDPSEEEKAALIMILLTLI